MLAAHSTLLNRTLVPQIGPNDQADAALAESTWSVREGAPASIVDLQQHDLKAEAHHSRESRVLDGSNSERNRHRDEEKERWWESKRKELENERSMLQLQVSTLQSELEKCRRLLRMKGATAEPGSMQTSGDWGVVGVTVLAHGLLFTTFLMAACRLLEGCSNMVVSGENSVWRENCLRANMMCVSTVMSLLRETIRMWAEKAVEAMLG